MDLSYRATNRPCRKCSAWLCYTCRWTFCNL